MTNDKLPQTEPTRQSYGLVRDELSNRTFICKSNSDEPAIFYARAQISGRNFFFNTDAGFNRLHKPEWHRNVPDHVAFAKSVLSCELVQTSLRSDSHFTAWNRSLRFLNKLQFIPSFHNMHFKPIAKDTEITGSIKLVHCHFQEKPSVDYESSSDEEISQPNSKKAYTHASADIEQTASESDVDNPPHDNSVMETLTNVTPYPDIDKYDVTVNGDLLPLLKDLYTVKLLPLYLPNKGSISLVKERKYSIAKFAHAGVSFPVSYTQAKMDEVVWHLQPIRILLLKTLLGHSIENMGRSSKKRKRVDESFVGSSSRDNLQKNHVDEIDDSRIWNAYFSGSIYCYCNQISFTELNGFLWVLFFRAGASEWNDVSSSCSEFYFVTRFFLLFFPSLVLMTV